jgi:hypothetical protein
MAQWNDPAPDRRRRWRGPIRRLSTDDRRRPGNNGELEYMIRCRPGHGGLFLGVLASAIRVSTPSFTAIPMRRPQSGDLMFYQKGAGARRAAL